jgi:iron complex transport system substrate-binding protein
VQTGHGALDQDEVAQRLSECVGKPVRIVHMDPQNLEDVWGDFIRVANALHKPEKGRAAVQRMRDRIQLVQGLAKGRQKRKVLCLQWLDPLFAAGAWVPELLSLAGGESVAAEAGGPSVALSAESLTEVHPEVVIFAICGCDLKQSVTEVTSAAKRGILESVEKVKVGRLAMAVVNAAKLFSRPGPTLVESLEVLAEVLYPESQPFGHKGKLWASLELLQST